MPYNPQTMNIRAAQLNADASRNSYGASGPQVIDAPAGTKYFALKKEMIGQDIYLNILPWGIESNKHMGVRNGKAQIGQGEFLLEMWTHRVEGATQGTTLCTQAMYGERCPFCEAAKMTGANPKPSHRMALWVQQVDVHGNPLNNDPTPKLFITSYATFGKALLEAADIKGRRLGLGGPVPFAAVDNVDGKVVTFNVASKFMGNGVSFCEATNFEFLPRANPISPNILSSIPGLDAFLHIPTEKEIHDALYGAATPEEANVDPAYQQPAYPEAAQAQPAYAQPAYQQPTQQAAMGQAMTGDALHQWNEQHAPAPQAYQQPATPYGAPAQVPHGARPTAPAQQTAPTQPMESAYPEPTF